MNTDFDYINNFALILKEIDQSVSYISFENGHYSRVTCKNSKKLGTEKIAQIAEDIFKKIDQLGASSSFQQRILFENLRTGLKSYRARLYKSKNFFQKIGDFFGIVSVHERRIINLYNMLMPVTDGDINPANVLKNLYRGVLGSIVTKEPKLTKGAAPGLSFDWYLSHLKNFYLTPQMQGYGKVDQLQLSGYIEKLELAKKMYGLAINSEKEHAVENTLAAFRNLRIEDYLLLPGGHFKHAVLYCIRRTKKGFEFHVINGGEGINKVTGSTCSKVKALEVVYVNFLEDKISHSFLYKLFSFLKDESIHMEEIHAFLEHTLGKKEESAGRLHSFQIKGNCTYKCISLANKKFLSKKLCLDFKRWMTEQELEIHQERIKFGYYSGLEIDLASLAPQLETILSKRKQKYAAAL